MKIVVAIKSVPDTTTQIRVATDAPHTIDLAGVKFITSPYDEMALEQALRLREEHGGEVVAITLGGAQGGAVLRGALTLGADRAVHLEAESPTGLELDGFQTASALANFLRTETFDLLLCGRLAIDDQSAQVGTLTARLLDRPVVNEVTGIEATEDAFRFQRTVDGRGQVVECEAPAVATAEKGLAEPRRPSMKSIMAAKKKTLETVTAQLPSATLEVIALEPPPPRQPGRIVGEGVEAVEELVQLLEQEAKVL